MYVFLGGFMKKIKKNMGIILALALLFAGAAFPVRAEAAASTREESREAPEQLAWVLAFPEATRAGP